MNILKNTKALIALSVVVAAIGGSQVYACRDTFAALAHEKTETKSVAKKETMPKVLLRQRRKLKRQRSNLLKRHRVKPHHPRQRRLSPNRNSLLHSNRLKRADFA